MSNPTIIERIKKNPVNWFIVLQFLILGLGYFFYTINRMSFPIGLKDIGKTFDFTATQISSLGTIFLLGQVLINIPAGYLVDRFRARNVFFFALLGTGITTLAFVYFTSNYITAVTFRVAFGMVQGIFNVCLFSFVGKWFPDRRGLFVNLMALFYAIGNLIGLPIFGYLLMFTNNWRFPLQVFAICAIVWGVVILVAFRINEKNFSSAKEQKKKTNLEEGFGTSLLKVVKNSNVWRGLSIFMLNMIPQWGFPGVGAYLLINHKDVSPLVAGFVIGTAFGLGQALSPIFGYLSDKIGRKPVFIMLAALASVSFYFLFVSSITTTWVLMIFGLFVGISNTIYYLGYATIQDAVSTEYTGLATGLGATSGAVCGALSGILIGLITDSLGYQAAAYICLILPEVLIMLVAALFLKNKAKDNIVSSIE